jgi:hypothetical protein
MFLYIQGFGLTRLRVTTSIFMVFLVLVFLAVFIRLFACKFPYMKAIVAVFCVIWLSVGFCNIDRVIVNYNVEAYQSKKLQTVDVDTLQYMPESVPYLLELSNDQNREIAMKAHNALVDWFFKYHGLECECGADYACPHEGFAYYHVDEYGYNYDQGYYGEYACLYEQEFMPQTTVVQLNQGFDLRSYNLLDQKTADFLLQHKAEILAQKQY